MSENVSPLHPGAYVKKNVIPKGVSVKKAAEMLGIGRPALSNFLNGKANLSLNMSTRLEKAFGINKKDLLNLQQEYDSFINRDEEKRIAVKSYTPSFLKITAVQIDTWAGKIEARSLLAALLRRLVNTTGGEIIASNFPAYDKSQTPGWDGTVDSNNATPWIPSGVSGWEFGCDKVPKTKADGDYKARTNAIPESERKEITFVFVTPRNWTKKDDWIKTTKAKNEWKDIRAFDANDIEQWLELSISAQVWMAEQLGLPANGCESLNQYWEFWSQTASPAISPKIFNSGISNYGKTLTNWYQSNPGNPLIISAASKEEAKAFLCCMAKQVEDLQSLLDQAIFVSSSETLKRLSEVSTEFIPIAYTDEAQQELVVSFKNRHSIVISERNIKGVEADIILDLPNFESFKEALDDMGFDDAQIDVYANQSGNSPTILRRQLAKIPALRKPAWASLSKRLRTMIPLVLAGTWSVSKEADKEILSCLANESYLKIEREIAELVSMDDSPIWSEGKYRGVISGLDCFYAISDHLTEEDVNNFFDLAEYVLSEDDPALDLEKENRWAANIYNKVRDHSAAIRQSLCQNLIILAVHGNGLFGQRLGIDIESRVSYLIRTLLKEKDSRVWQAQQDDLPKYAEAAPNMFLSIVEEELQKNLPAFKVLFEPVESGVFSRCERTGMLWALELLAWTPSLLARVVKVLGKLSIYGLDDNWTNKPINSLKDIFLIWKPHTAASVEQRCEVLEMLCKQFPKIGWEICIQPLEPGSSITSGTYRPSWRGDASNAANTVTNGEVRQYGLKCLELVLSWPSHSTKTLKDLVNCLPSMEDDDQKKVIQQVKKWVESSPQDEDIIDLREHVRTRTMTTRALRNNKEKNKNGYANGKELYELLEPKDLLLKHQWLFAKNWIEYTPEELDKDSLDHGARDRWLEKQRDSALNEIVNKFGIKGIIRLLKKSGSGFQIGAHLFKNIFGKENVSEFILECLLVSEDHPYEFDNCIAGMLYQMTENKRELLLSDLINQLFSKSDREDDISRIFINAPFCRHTWNQLEMQNEKIQKKYWSRIYPGGWSDLLPEDINYAINKLLSVDRHFAAFDLAQFKLNLVESECLITLLNRIASGSSEPNINYKPSQYHIEDALKSLDERNDFDRMELVKLEYLYVDILYSHSMYGIPNLSKEISESPLFFMQLVAYSFKRKDNGKDPVDWELPQDENARSIAATKAYHVLDCLNVIPGSQNDGSIDIRKLREWVLQVRKLAKEHSREKITDQQIGKLFSTSDEGNDEIWPREEIRKVFEEIGSTEISIGMELGLYNSAGAKLRPVDSSRERTTAEKYQKMAMKAMNNTPFVGKMLMNMADRYVHEAEMWDADRRVNKRLHGW